MVDAFRGVFGLEAPLAARGLRRQARPARQVAASVVAAFLLVGLGWVFVTDILLYRLTDDPVLIARVETAKGWAFVALSALLLYQITLRRTEHLTHAWRLTAAVVDSLAEGVFLIGPDRRISYVNRSAAQILDTPAAELVGMNVDEFARRFRVSYPDGRLVDPDAYVSIRVFEEGGPLRYKAMLFPPGRDRVVFVATAAAVRMGVDEPPECAVTVLHDITEVDQLDHLRDQFLSAAAHALKTPVTIIRADAQLLAPSLSPKHARIAASLMRQCDRIHRIVQNLLVLARARSGTLELHQTEVELAPLITRIAREPLWSFRHELGVEVAGAPRIHADDERLALVLRNLLHEASRLSPEGSRIVLYATPDGEHVDLGVRYRPLAWRDAASDTYGEYDDIGIGRSLARQIVEAHGGTIGEDVADSEVEISIRVPAVVGGTR